MVPHLGRVWLDFCAHWAPTLDEATAVVDKLGMRALVRGASVKQDVPGLRAALDLAVDLPPPAKAHVLALLAAVDYSKLGKKQAITFCFCLCMLICFAEKKNWPGCRMRCRSRPIGTSTALPQAGWPGMQENDFPCFNPFRAQPVRGGVRRR